ncbi:hypothetical protein [Streptomyces sp. NPDC093589]|uniref:hypothetical protein n=1 Tax=Streptomyces sp. NPDC093589 TaxID=3366043 RepID=UPI0037F20B48
MLDVSDDVMGVITQQIEARFDMRLSELRRAVTAAPQANGEATAIVHWHGLLAESQKALERAEDALVGILESQPGELDDPEMEAAHRVNAAVTARDGRAMVVTYLLDADAPGKRAPGPWLGASPAVRRGPALQTSQPTHAVAPAAPARRGSR